MITIIYRLIVALTILLVLAELFEQQSVKLKINAALILIPLVLRVFMIA